MRRSSETSRKLAAARASARLQLQQVAAALGVHPRTVGRWEVGLASPRRALWPKVVAYYAQFVPVIAVELSRIAGIPSPFPPAPVVDLRAIQDALLRAADILDVSPRRVRAAVRELTKAVAEANGTLDDLARAVLEKSVAQQDGARVR